tara:strand:+ start:3144 stop:3359 length:216 start_codon:yes stop_codon:yes gene_type:complete
VGQLLSISSFAQQYEETTMYHHILVAVAFDEESDPERSSQVAQVPADKATRVTVLHVKEGNRSIATAVTAP